MQKFEFKHGRGLLSFCIFFPIIVLIFLVIFLSNPNFGFTSFLAIMALSAITFITTEKLTEADGFGILHENYVEIHLKNKLYTIEYKHIKKIVRFPGQRYWTIALDDGSDMNLHLGLFKRYNQIFIDRPLRLMKHDPLTIFIKALDEKVS